RLYTISPLSPYTTLFRSELSGRGRSAWRAPCRGAQSPRRVQRHGTRVDFFAHGESFLSGARLKESCQQPFSNTRAPPEKRISPRSEEHTSELQSLAYLVC